MFLRVGRVEFYNPLLIQPHSPISIQKLSMYRVQPPHLILVLFIAPPHLILFVLFLHMLVKSFTFNLSNLTPAHPYLILVPPSHLISRISSCCISLTCLHLTRKYEVQGIYLLHIYSFFLCRQHIIMMISNS